MSEQFWASYGAAAKRDKDLRRETNSAPWTAYKTEKNERLFLIKYTSERESLSEDASIQSQMFLKPVFKGMFKFKVSQWKYQLCWTLSSTKGGIELLKV